MRIGTRLQSLIAALGIVLFFVFLLAPIAIMFPASFTAQDVLMFPPTSYSSRWYAEVFRSRDWLSSADVSLRTSIVAMLLATVAGSLVGLLAYRFGPIDPKIRLLLLSPMLVPHVVIATGLFEILVPARLLGSFWVLAIAQGAMALPVAVILSINAFEAIDRNFWVAASTLGARWPQIIGKVLFPVAGTSIIACLILTFESAWHEVTLSVFIGPAITPTLPRRMFSYLTQETSPALAAVSALLLLVTLACALLLLALSSRGKARVQPASHD